MHLQALAEGQDLPGDGTRDFQSADQLPPNQDLVSLQTLTPVRCSDRWQCTFMAMLKDVTFVGSQLQHIAYYVSS